MLKAKKSILVTLFVLFVLSSFGIASADQIDGLASTSGLPPVTNVYVNPGHMGDALIYNYFNARNGMQTFFTVTNTSSLGERVRVRFREAADVPNALCQDSTGKGTAAGSFEILDFDVCLTGHDEWSGFVTAAPGGGAMLCSNDTDTLIWDGTNSAAFPSSCVPFKYGANNSNAAITADDTMEGYFEIIGEDQMVSEPLTCNPAGNSSVTPNIPIQDCFNTANDCPVDVPNALFGNAALIDGNTSGTFAYDAAALANFANGNLQVGVTTSLPTLADGQDGLFGVNYVLTKDHVFSIYDLIHARSEIVLTEPTKLLTQENAGCTPPNVNNNVFTDDSALFTVYNDSEQSLTTVCSFSPCPAGVVNSLPFEVNVLQMNIPTAGVVSDILDSTVDQVVAINFDFGWIDVNLNPTLSPAISPAHATLDPNTGTEVSLGWPILGTMFLDVDQGASTAAFPVQYSNDVVPAVL